MRELEILAQIRGAWRPESYNLMAAMSLAVNPGGDVDLGTVAAMDEREVARQLLEMPLVAIEDRKFSELALSLVRPWRAALLSAYGASVHRSMPENFLLAPTRALDEDASGRFLEMQFIPRADSLAS